jgi:hypothetical protein
MTLCYVTQPLLELARDFDFMDIFSVKRRRAIGVVGWGVERVN